MASSSASARREAPSRERSEWNWLPSGKALASRSSGERRSPSDPLARESPEFASLSRRLATKDESIGIYVPPAVGTRLIRSADNCMNPRGWVRSHACSGGRQPSIGRIWLGWQPTHADRPDRLARSSFNLILGIGIRPVAHERVDRARHGWHCPESIEMPNSALPQHPPKLAGRPALR